MKHKLCSTLIALLLASACFFQLPAVSFAQESSDIPQEEVLLETGQEETPETGQEADLEPVQEETAEEIPEVALEETGAAPEEALEEQPVTEASPAAEKAEPVYKTGLYKVDGVWKYYEKGSFSKKTGMVRRSTDRKWCYVEKGIFKKATGMTHRIADGKCFYVKNGFLCRKTGIVKSLFNDKHYYVKKGIYRKDTLFAKKLGSHSSKLYFVKRGVVQKKAETPVLDAQSFGSNSTRLMVTWKKVTAADGYYVYRATSKNGSYKLVNITQTSCRYLDTGLQPSTTYYYRIRAYVGNPLKKPGDRVFVSSSDVDYATTAAENRSVHYTSYISPTSSNTISVRQANKKTAQIIYDRLQKGYNFYVYVYNTGSNTVINQLKSQVRKISDIGINFQYLKSYASGSGKYYLIDAETFYYVNKYIHMAYKERMAEYKTWLDCGQKKDYFYTHKNETSYSYDFVAKYRDNLFECEYGTPFKELSTESKVLFITPGTNMTVRTNYMNFKFSYNVGENATDILRKMCNKSANGVCRHYALAMQTLCDYLGIECWMPVDWGYNHQWAFIKTTSEAGDTVYYTMDNENVHITASEYDLKHERLGDYSPAVKRALGSAYPW